MSTGMPRPSSLTSTEPSACTVTSIVVAWPLTASSTELSMTSWARWFGREVSVYMPGRRLTGSRPERTSMSAALYLLLIQKFRNDKPHNGGGCAVADQVSTAPQHDRGEACTFGMRSRVVVPMPRFDREAGCEAECGE